MSNTVKPGATRGQVVQIAWTGYDAIWKALSECGLDAETARQIFQNDKAFAEAIRTAALSFFTNLHASNKEQNKEAA